MPTWSPLCETDTVAYLTFLALEHGERRGAFGVDSGLGVGVSDVGRLVYTDQSSGAVDKVDDVAVPCEGIAQCGLGVVRRELSGGVVRESFESEAGRLAGCIVASVFSGRGCEFDVESGNKSETSVRLGEVVRDSGSVESDQLSRDPVGEGSDGESDVFRHVDVPVRGSNWVRNRENRAKKKERKLKRQAMGQDWRKPAARVGFFSSCSDDVQVKLRESRAAMLIATNERRALEEKAKVAGNSAERDFVREVMSVLRVAERLKKESAGLPISGWAKTVAESITSSVIEKAPSSVPSLESVGVGSSAKSNFGDDEKRDARMFQYQAACRQLELYYDSQDVFSSDDKVMDERSLKEQFADVAFSDVERAERALAKKLYHALQCGGRYGVADVDSAFEIAGIVDF